MPILSCTRLRSEIVLSVGVELAELVLPLPAPQPERSRALARESASRVRG